MRQLFVAILLVFIIFSCKKEDDTQMPSITITEPTGANFEVFDTIWIKAKITDNEIVKSVTYGITDSNADYIANAKVKTYDSKNVDFSGYIILNDVRTESGNYTLTITAFDGNNTKKQFKQIYIKALTKKLEKIYITTETANNTKVYELLEQNDFELKYTHYDNITDAEVNSYLRSMYLLDKSGNLKSISLNNFEPYWEVNNLNNNLVEYNGKLMIYDDFCFASVKKNNIQAFDINGNVRKTAVSELYAYEPSCFTIQNGFFVNYTYNNSISSNYIEKLYYSGGASQTYYSVNIDVIDILPLNSNEIIAFGNKLDTMRIVTLKLNATQLQYVDFDVSDKLIAVVKINDDKFLFSTNNGLFLYDGNYLGHAIYINDILADYLIYEELNKSIYCLKGNEVTVLNSDDYSTINTFTLPGKATKILFEYNK